LDIILPDYKYVPQLPENLFSIINALDHGLRTSNKGVSISLSKDRNVIWFDWIFTTEHGNLSGKYIFKI